MINYMYTNYAWINTSLLFFILRLRFYCLVYRGEPRQTFTHSSHWRAETNFTVVYFLALLDLHIGYSLFLVFGIPGVENFLTTVLQRYGETFHA